MVSGPAAARLSGAITSIGLLVAAAAGVAHVRETRYPAPELTADSLYLRSGTTARRLTAGYSALAADLYWIRAIQYYGDLRLKSERSPAAKPGPWAVEVSPPSARFELLYPLLDLTTSLDPRFNIAYRFGSIFLAEAYPGGADRPDLAIALLEKGLREQPDKWEYMQDIGFVHYWWEHDYKTAAEWFKRASEVPGSPWFLRSLAATTMAEGGDRRASRALWQSIGESADNDWLRSDADRRLKQLDALDVIDALQQGVDRFAARLAAPATDWTGFIRAGLIKGVPLDPAGVPYVFDPPGHVTVSDKSPLFPLTREPQRNAPGA